MLVPTLEWLSLWEAFHETRILRDHLATGTLVSPTLKPSSTASACPGNGQSYFEARSECEESGGRLLDLSQQAELERVTQLGTALGWTGGWGEAWLWLSAHPDGDLTDGNGTAWRWDWVERPRNGGHISGAMLEGKSGKKVIPNHRYLSKMYELLT